MSKKRKRGDAHIRSGDELLIELLSLLPPQPSNPTRATARDITQLQDRLGVVLSDDHVKLLRKYGAGWIDDFLWIPSPVKGGHGADLYSQVEDSAAELKEPENLVRERLGANVWPDADCLMVFARSSNGDMLLWDQVGSRVVVIDSKGLRTESFGMSVLEFLVGLLKGTVVVSFFPKPAFLERVPHVYSLTYGQAS